MLRIVAAMGAVIDYTLIAYTHTTPIPKTHYYVEREYASIDEGMTKAQRRREASRGADTGAWG